VLFSTYNVPRRGYDAFRSWAHRYKGQVDGLPTYARLNRMADAANAKSETMENRTYTIQNKALAQKLGYATTEYVIRNPLHLVAELLADGLNVHPDNLWSAAPKFNAEATREYSHMMTAGKCIRCVITGDSAQTRSNANLGAFCQSR
jgi:lambda repressor-like predicted transcriptional regulator